MVLTMRLWETDGTSVEAERIEGGVCCTWTACIVGRG